MWEVVNIAVVFTLVHGLLSGCAVCCVIAWLDVVLRIAFNDGLSHVGASVNSCVAHVIARHRVMKNHRLTWFGLFVCGVFASEHIWHISSHYASLQSTGSALGVAPRDGRLFTGMPEANPCISYFFVTQIRWWLETKFRMSAVGFF